MNNYYKQSVVAFGIVIPLILILVVIGVAFYFSSSIGSEYKKKKMAYDKERQAMQHTMALQGKVQSTADYVKEWDNLLATETRGTFLEHWKRAEEKFSGKELTKTSHNWTNYSGGLGKGVGQPASQVNMSFSATYRAMQMAMLEMETKLPQMQLDSLTIKPDRNGETVNFNTTFTVWTLK